VYSLGLNIPPRTVTVLHLESRASKIYDSTNKETADVKWRELDFSLLLSSALTCTPRIVAIRGIKKYLSAELSNGVTSSTGTRHFTSRFPLFDASLLFDARLFRCKTETQRIV
jgi:hypothetical protein